MADILERRRRVADGGAPLSAGTPAAGGGGAAVGGVPAPAAPQQGSGFVGLDQYLAANRQGAQDMANKVAGAVDAKGQAGQQALQGAQDTFAQKSQAATLGFDPKKATTSTQAAAIAAGGTYQGPRDFAEAGVDVAGGLAKAGAGADAARALGTAGGVSAALQESYNSGPRTAGGSALDTALTQAAGGGRFAELQKMYGNLDSRFITAAGGTQAAYDANTASTAAAAQQYQQQAGQLADEERFQESLRQAELARLEQEKHNGTNPGDKMTRQPRRRAGEL